MRLQFFLVVSLMLFVSTQQLNARALEEKPIVLLITSYNNSNWYKRNLDCAFSQNYSNFRIIYVDDFSDDDTANLVEQYVIENGWQDRVTLVKNDVRKFKLENFYDAVHKFCRDEEIVIDYDGDDFLANNNVLSVINKAYSNPEVWMTYGTYETWPKKGFCWCATLPNKVIVQGTYRQYKYVTSHLRSFYAWLFKKVKVEDFMHEGSFIYRATDLAYMFPLLEMAGGRFRYIKDVLYFYNTSNPLGSNKVGRKEQAFFDSVVRKKQRYKRLEESKF